MRAVKRPPQRQRSQQTEQQQPGVTAQILRMPNVIAVDCQQKRRYRTCSPSGKPFYQRKNHCHRQHRRKDYPQPHGKYRHTRQPFPQMQQQVKRRRMGVNGMADRNNFCGGKGGICRAGGFVSAQTLPV